MLIDFIIHSKTHAMSIDDNIILFGCLNPIIIQPSEIKKVQTVIEFRIPEGYVLNISTWSGLYERAAEIFPAAIVLDHKYVGELFIPVRNSGRDPLNLMAGMAIAQGYFVKIEKIIPQELELQEASKERLPNTKPQKKNDNFKFEVK